MQESENCKMPAANTVLGKQQSGTDGYLMTSEAFSIFFLISSVQR